MTRPMDTGGERKTVALAVLTYLWAIPTGLLLGGFRQSALIATLFALGMTLGLALSWGVCGK